MARRRLPWILLLAAALHLVGMARVIVPAQDGLKFLRVARQFQTQPGAGGAAPRRWGAGSPPGSATGRGRRWWWRRWRSSPRRHFEAGATRSGWPGAQAVTTDFSPWFGRAQPLTSDFSPIRRPPTRVGLK